MVAKVPVSSASKVMRHGLARTLSKLGFCSRTEAAAWIGAGRVRVDGRVVTDIEFPIVSGTHRIAIDGVEARGGEARYVMLNKPRGLVTTAHDERGRETVYRCFVGSELGWIAPVGRLDKASEGLLLFANDPEWAARITEPGTGPSKTYHVQVDRIPDPLLLARLVEGVEVQGELLCAGSASLLRCGARNAWLEIVLDEGRNRQIRRLLNAFDCNVLRLIRVAVGELVLGDLPKGQWRHLSAAEVAGLAASSD